MCKLPSNTLQHLPGHLGRTGVARNSAVIFGSIGISYRYFKICCHWNWKYKALKWVDSSLGHEEQNLRPWCLPIKCFDDVTGASTNCMALYSFTLAFLFPLGPCAYCCWQPYKWHVEVQTSLRVNNFFRNGVDHEFVFISGFIRGLSCGPWSPQVWCVSFGVQRWNCVENVRLSSTLREEKHYFGSLNLIFG